MSRVVGRFVRVKNELVGMLKSACLLVLIASSPVIANDSAPIRLGIPPYLERSQLETNFEPLRQQLEGFFVQGANFSFADDYDGFRQSISQDHFDVVILSAFDYLHVKNDTRYLPVARFIGYQIINIVAASGEVSSARDLRGKRVGFGSASSPTTILGKLLLVDAGLSDSDYRQLTFPSFDICLQRMLEDDVDACVTYQLGAKNFFAERKISYRVLASSRIVPQPIILVKKELAHKREALAGYLRSLNKDREFKLTLGSGFPMDFVEVIHSDFEKIDSIYKSNQSLFD
ncbi:hypothetical protein NBRC116494_10780 [Aurantivibrio plasticivorans]